MKGNPLGLDIGVNTTKAVWLSEQKEGYSLLSALSAPTPARGMGSEAPLDLEEMAQLIRRMVVEGKIATQSVNVALSENHVYTKVLEMPVLSDRELASAIYWEAEQYIPVPLANITLDWKVLRRPSGDGSQTKMQVLLVGAPTELVEKYEKVLAMGGLEIFSIETEILAAARALITDNFPTSLIVNIGAVTTSIAIVKENTIVFTYATQTGGRAITRAIAADFGFTLVQAEEYKKVYGVTDKTSGGKIGQTTVPILLSIVGEVKKALSFYNDRYKEQPIAQIIISGGTAKLPGIDLFFAQNCGIETAIANPWNILSGQEIPKELVDNGPEYVVAVGLAMRNYE